MTRGLLHTLLDLGLLAGHGVFLLAVRRAWRGSGLDLSFGAFLLRLALPAGRTHGGGLRERWTLGFDEPVFRRLRLSFVLLWAGYAAAAIVLDRVAA